MLCVTFILCTIVKKYIESTLVAGPRDDID